MNITWKHVLMVGGGALAAAAAYCVTADPANAGIWHGVEGLFGVVALFFGGSSPAMFGKDVHS
jgi:hypothetical protein